jgi:hypothetical protein
MTVTKHLKSAAGVSFSAACEAHTLLEGAAAGPLHSVMAEEIVLVPRRAVRASQAADQKHCHTNCNQHGDYASVRREPMNSVLHIQETHSVYWMLPRCTEYTSKGIEHLQAGIPVNQSYHRPNFPVIPSDSSCHLENKRRKSIQDGTRSQFDA